MSETLPTYITRDVVAERLPLIFTEGTPNRTYCVRELAASTVFTALYIGAVEGADVYLGPVHVYRMTDLQATKSSDEQRVAYRALATSMSAVIGRIGTCGGDSKPPSDGSDSGVERHEQRWRHEADIERETHPQIDEEGCGLAEVDVGNAAVRRA